MQSSLFFVLFAVALCNARTVLWTAAGGNPLWNNAGNWDCQCLPTSDDDVIIDIQAIPGNVLIGGVQAPALAKSLTLGGSSKFSQSLTITGPITVGTGNSVLNANGVINFQAGPDAPFINGGTFTVHGTGFIFSSGTLAGQGTFVFANDAIFNLTGAASKMISTNLVVNGKLQTYTPTSTNLVLTGGHVTVAGTFVTPTSLTIATDSASSFLVKGTFTFTGPTLILQGSGFNFGTWSVGNSQVTIDNGITSGDLDLASGAVLTLIGGPTDKRTFTKITGSGSIENQGGANTFGTVACNSFKAFGGNATVTSGTVNSLTLNGAFLAGTKIVSGATVLAAGFVTGGLTIQSTSTDFQGTVGIDGDNTVVLTLTTATVSRQALLTMAGGSSLQVATSCAFNQGSPFQIVQGAPQSRSPSFIQNGQWSSSASVSLTTVPVSGNTGGYTLTSGASWTLNTMNFAGKTFHSMGQVSISAGTFTVGGVTGTGTFSGNPNTFTAGGLTANTFTLTSGNVSASNVTLTNLNIVNGVFGVATSAKLTTFTFSGGKLMGSITGTQAAITATNTVLKGNVQSLANLELTTNNVSLECTGSCQLLTNNAAVRTASSQKAKSY